MSDEARRLRRRAPVRLLVCGALIGGLAVVLLVLATAGASDASPLRLAMAVLQLALGAVFVWLFISRRRRASGLESAAAAAHDATPPGGAEP